MCSKENCDINEIKSRLLTSMPEAVNMIMGLRFQTLEHDHERIDMVYELMKARRLFAKYVEDKKDNYTADKLRQQGNKKFQKQKFIEALEFYTKSIAKAEPDSESIALAYGNRSAVLFEKKHYEDCLVDIERAFQNNYPEKLVKQLQERKEKATRLKETHKHMHIYEPVPDILESERNPKIECASNSIMIKKNNSMGRHLVAKRDIKVGEVVAIEKPFVQVLLNEKERHCHECLIICYTLMPCKSCSQAMFCSESCRDTAYETYHKYECPILATMNDLDFDEEVRLAIRIIFKSRNDLKKLEELKNQKHEIYKSDRLDEICDLNTHEDERSLSDCLNRAIEACLIYELIEQHTDFLDDMNKIHKSVGAVIFKDLLLKLMQIVVINAGRTVELGQDKKQADLYSDVMLGYDICSLGSLVNNGCCPNVLFIRHGNYKTIRVIQSIEKGQPLLNNYAAHYTAVDKISRQNSLRERYFFDCECEPCTNNWPTAINLPLKAIRLHNDLAKVKKPNIQGANEVLEKWLPQIKRVESERPSYSFFDIQEIIKQCYSIFGNKQITF